MSDLAKMFAENQKEMMKLIVPTHQNVQDSDSKTENISVARTSTPLKTNTATSKTTPINSRNRCNMRFVFSFEDSSQITSTN